MPGWSSRAGFRVGQARAPCRHRCAGRTPHLQGRLLPRSGGQDPDTAAAGQALAGQVAQVQRGGTPLEPGVVPGGPAVTELEAPASPGGDLGDGAFHVGPPGHVVLALPGPAGAGGAQQVIAGMQDELAAGLAGGARRAERAVAAHGAEGGDAGPAETDGVPGRAGDRAGLLIDGEVIDGEPSLDRGPQGLGLDHRLVPGISDRAAQVPGAIGGIAVPGTTSAFASLTSAETRASLAAGSSQSIFGLPGRL